MKKLGQHITLFLIAISIAACSASNQEVDQGKSHAELNVTSQERASIAALTEEATQIIMGHVEKVDVRREKVAWLPREIFITEATIDVDTSLKGAHEQRLAVMSLGGCIHDECVSVSHQAKFEEGERVLLFLNPSLNDHYVVTHNESGKVNLSGDNEISESELVSVIGSLLRIEGSQ
jgi:hypothetical protein